MGVVPDESGAAQLVVGAAGYGPGEVGRTLSKKEGLPGYQPLGELPWPFGVGMAQASTAGWREGTSFAWLSTLAASRCRKSPAIVAAAAL